MLRRNLRVTKAREYSRIYKFGRQISSPHLRLFYIKAPNQNPTRFGFVISKKQVGKIALRNRLKRVLRSEIASLETRFIPGHEVIVQIRALVPHTKVEEVRKELPAILFKANLLKK